MCTPNLKRKKRSSSRDDASSKTNESDDENKHPAKHPAKPPAKPPHDGMDPFDKQLETDCDLDERKTPARIDTKPLRRSTRSTTKRPKYTYEDDSEETETDDSETETDDSETETDDSETETDSDSDDDETKNRRKPPTRKPPTHKTDSGNSMVDKTDTIKTTIKTKTKTKTDCSYQPRSLINPRYTRVQSCRGGEAIANPTNVATDLEFQTFNESISVSNDTGSSLTTELTPPVFRYMQKHGMIKMVPHEIEYLSHAGDKPRNECFRVATNPNFVSIPDDFVNGSGYHQLDDKGDGYRILENGVILFPVVYYICAEGGFAISCRREYLYPDKALVHLMDGTADILGRRTWLVKNGKKGFFNKTRYFVRHYYIQSSTKRRDNLKRRFFANHYDMTKAQFTGYLAPVILATFIGPRPKGFIAQHDGEAWENMLECLRWIPSRENSLKENRDPNATEKRPYSITVMPIDESTLENDVWFSHPTKPVIVNEDGTHVYNVQSEKFMNIRLLEWTTCDWKELRVTVMSGGSSSTATQSKAAASSSVTNQCFLGKLALECFMGRELLPKETCEHIDCNRTNNSKKNLIPRYRLFQANATKRHKLASTGNDVIGVIEFQDKRGWIASVRVYTPDGPTASVEKRKYFFNSQYGDSSEKAKEAATAYRQKYTLRDGMVWV